MIKTALCQFFTQLHRGFPNVLDEPFEARHQVNNTQLIKKALETLAQSYKEKITIAEMSAQSNLSDQHFCRLFKAYTGKTFIEYVTDLRLEHANRLLTGTDLPITQIPELTGFCNANYFSRVYKSRYGYAPSHVRKIANASDVSSATNANSDMIWQEAKKKC